MTCWRRSSPRFLCRQCRCVKARKPMKPSDRPRLSIFSRTGDGSDPAADASAGDYRSLFLWLRLSTLPTCASTTRRRHTYIDWNVTARMDTPYVRQYMEDRESQLVPGRLSPSMDFGPARPKAHGLIDLWARWPPADGATATGGASCTVPENGRNGTRCSGLSRPGRTQPCCADHDMLAAPPAPRPFTDWVPMLQAGCF